MSLRVVDETGVRQTFEATRVGRYVDLVGRRRAERPECAATALGAEICRRERRLGGGSDD